MFGFGFSGFTLRHCNDIANFWPGKSYTSSFEEIRVSVANSVTKFSIWRNNFNNFPFFFPNRATSLTNPRYNVTFFKGCTNHNYSLIFMFCLIIDTVPQS
ncbi:hypothetical protein IFY68_05489 (plasmid) [Klebsiella pneumoniae]|nr:hypothetical protein IFY68_05489 [Klebsiella pneumoniae]SYF74527.1 Uncharacterised protein [Klebsiella pneumoniae]